jgi:hypothetical protein
MNTKKKETSLWKSLKVDFQGPATNSTMYIYMNTNGENVVGNELRINEYATLFS